MPGRVLTAAEEREVLHLLWPSRRHTGSHNDREEWDADAQRWRQQRFELPALSDDCGAAALFPLGLRQTHGGPCGVLAAVQAELLRLALFPNACDSTVAKEECVSSDGERDGECGSARGDALQRLVARVQRAGEHAQLSLLTEALASVLFRCTRDDAGGTDNTDNGGSEGCGGRRGGVSDAEGGTRRVLVRLVALSDTNAAKEGRGGETVDAADSDVREQQTRPEVFVEEEVLAAHGRDPALLRAVHARLPALQSPGGVLGFVFSAVRTKSVAAIRAEMDDLDAALTGQFGHCSQELLNLLLTGCAVSNVFDGSVPLGGDGDNSGLTLRGVPERARVGYLTQLEALRYCQVGSYYKSPVYPIWVVGSTSHFSVCFGLDRVLCAESPSQRLFQRVHRAFKAFNAHETGFMAVSSLVASLGQLGVSPEVLSSEYSMARLLARLEVAGAGIVLWDEYWKVVSVLLHTGDLELALSGEYGSELDGSRSQQIERPRSDSDLARELQAQFDAEEGGSRTLAAAASTPPATVDATRTTATPTALEEEGVFELYYYNGLGGSGAGVRQPQLTKCRVTVPKPVAFIGQSVPISETSTGGYASPPLEEILKTKWPAARIDWLGLPVPSVD
ncbi:hypothetical protein PybrP1_001186 [[Pythium] brassicae (nom. inval.)]|nr:hypothetical protein PybrP1_001186 [[Pythium] brassicae (nom. inval.)]